jgi:hypothetical protein
MAQAMIVQFSGRYRLTGLPMRFVGTGETERGADDMRQHEPQVSETRQDVGDGCLMAHNPEVVDLNPTHSTKLEDRIRTRIRASLLYLCTATSTNG